MSLDRHLNRLFRQPVTVRPKPGIHVFYDIEISKAGALWTATVDGQIHKNSKLCDIKMIIRTSRAARLSGGVA